MSGMGAVRETGQRILTRLRGWPRWARIPIGVLFMVGGVLGFLPVLGLWMLPLGLAVLAIDIPLAARAYRWLRRQSFRVLRWIRSWRKSRA
jgi:hypothetical protein